MRLSNEKIITSLELVKQINIFRKDVEGKKELRHDNLLNIIRDEFDEEISLLKIKESSYTNERNKTCPMFVLTIEQAKQVLVRESKVVRRSVIKKLAELEGGKVALTEKQQIEADKNEAILKLVNEGDTMSPQETANCIRIIESCDKKKFILQSKEEILLSEIIKTVKSVASVNCYEEDYVAEVNWNGKDLKDCLCKDHVLNKIKEGVYEVGVNFDILFIKTVMGNFKKDNTNNVFIPVFYRSSLEYFKSKTFIYALNQHLKTIKPQINVIVYESGNIVKEIED
ncbi:MAG: hypothetical protein ACRC5F_02685 [Cetobacterium sp.]